MKQFCPQGHDTLLKGRAMNGGCRICASIHSMAWAKRHPANKNAAMRKWSRGRGKDYKKRNPERTRDWARKQDWKGVLNSSGQQLTSKDYDLMAMIQNGMCANSFCRRKGKLHMDHDHLTMRFRGLLCGQCNRALGLCRESYRVLAGLLAYIHEWETSNAKIAV